MSRHIVIRYSGNDPSQPLVRFFGEDDSKHVQILVEGEETEIVFTGSAFSLERYKECKGEEKEKRFLSK
jgi:hypothetical protein